MDGNNQIAKPMISIIVAVASNGVIGDKNTLLWHIREDLQRFKALTTGHPVVMGRKTYESLGRPLPNRRNIVVSRQEIAIAGCEVVHSLTEALALFAAEEEVFIIGGAQIYAEALPWPTASTSPASNIPTRATPVSPNGTRRSGGSSRRKPSARRDLFPPIRLRDLRTTIDALDKSF